MPLLSRKPLVALFERDSTKMDQNIFEKFMFLDAESAKVRATNAKAAAWHAERETVSSALHR